MNRAVGVYLQEQGLNVIPNIRWQDKRSYDFCFDGVEKHQIPAFIKDVFEKGKLIKKCPKNGGYEQIYEYKGRKLVLTAVGTNGFITSVYPV